MPVRGLEECSNHTLVGRTDDLTLDLQAALHETHDESGYAHVSDRSGPEPALNPDDLAWA
jgi:hypothetical protein